MNNILDKSIKEGANVHELFNVALSSYSYLARAFAEIYKEEPKYDLKQEVSDYIDFIYDPSANFLDGIFAFITPVITSTEGL